MNLVTVCSNCHMVVDEDFGTCPLCRKALIKDMEEAKHNEHR